MVSSSKEKLQKILEEIENSSISLQRIKDLYFEAKETIFSEDDIGEEELTLSVNIFQEGDLRVREFSLKWNNEEIRPSDQELTILLTLCDEAANNWDFLANLFPSIFTEEKVEKRQREVNVFREEVLKEKNTRKNPQKERDVEEKKSEDVKSFQKRIDKLQDQIGALQSKGSEKEEIKKLKEYLEKLKKELIDFKNKPVSIDHSSDNSPSPPHAFSVKSFLIGVVICGIIVFVLFFFYQKKKKK